MAVLIYDIWNVGSITEKQNLHFITINLNLNGHACQEATVLDGAVLDYKKMEENLQIPLKKPV